MRWIDFLMSSIAFWLAWILIPAIMEIIPAIGNFLILIKKSIDQKEVIELQYYPEITLIVPVYNSEDTLKACIQSIYESNYPKDLIRVLLVNNQSKDNSFDIYTKAKEEFKGLYMSWMNSKQGKSKALNAALYSSEGKYIIHIDSDGILHPDALKNMVTMFEQNPKIHCLTGTIITNPEAIEATNSFFQRLIRKVEFFEYCQAFLAGRNFESEFNNIYTVSGAFSGFRKSAILKTQLYNTDTVCEDTHITFQVRDVLKKSVKLCPNAIFFVEPIANWNQLYIQRQRWQRGEIEVAHMFLSKRLYMGKGFLKDVTIRLIMYDHTFAFPRMIWYFAIICLTYMGYPMKYVAISILIVYVLYVFTSFLFYISVSIFLKQYRQLQRYYLRKWYICFIFPAYNATVFWFRFAGIINSIEGEQTWKMKNMIEERKTFLAVLKNDCLRILTIFRLRKKKDQL